MDRMGGREDIPQLEVVENCKQSFALSVLMTEGKWIRSPRSRKRCSIGREPV